jgi:rRNA processing protein Krr1/Pno1
MLGMVKILFHSILKLLKSKSLLANHNINTNILRYHDKIRRHVEREHKKLPQTQIPPQLLFGQQPTPKPGFNIRGRANDVRDLNTLIAAFIEQEKKDELERGFTTSFEYPHKLASHLIGRRGDNIKKLQEEFDVEINYTEGKVELKGPQAKCAACKSHILSMVKKLEDEATHTVKIPAQYHGDLKGAKGSQVMRLQERYNVRINFPRAVVAPDDDADAATERSFRNQPAQAPDVVIIKGPKKGADEAREELLSLLQYTMDHAHQGTVSVSSKQIPSLIGTGGRELESLRLETGCAIDMPKKEDAETSTNGRVEVRLKGTKTQVEAAKKLIQERAKAFDNTITESLDVDPKFYKTIIGPNGATLYKIVLDAGGPDDRRVMNRMVNFPKQGSGDNSIKLQGPKNVVQKIKSSIEALVSEREGQVTESINVPPEQHRHLIGAGGNIRRKIESECGVEVNIPKADTPGSERSNVTLVGKPANIQKARAHIESLLKEQASTTIDVPRCYHHVIADDGNFFRRLRSEHGVSVDHAGSKPPPKPTTGGASRGRANGSSLPLITDDPSEAKTHSWELVDHSVQDGDVTSTIPWVLRGNADKIAKAQATVEKAVQNASKPSCTGYLILSDPKLYRFVIGPQGSTVNSIRNQTSTQITVPRQGSGDEAIEVKGPKDGVEKARDMILDAVQQGNANSGPRKR